MSSNFEITKSCELCSISFIARKLTTRYCSHKCASRAYKLQKREERIKTVLESEATELGLSGKNDTEYNPIQNDSTNLNMQRLLSIKDVANIFNIERTTAYRYCIQGKLNCIKMNRKIFIRQQDIDKLFDSAPAYQVIPRQVKKKRDVSKIKNDPIKLTSKTNEKKDLDCITEYYTTDELVEKFGYSKSAIRKMAATKNIPKATRYGCYLYSKKHFDEVLTDKQIDESITEWYTVKEIMEIYTISKSSVYSLTSEHPITRKSQQGKMIYAKSEIDAILQHRLDDTSITEWYTNVEIKAEYGFEPSYVANFVFKNKIPRKRIGHKAYYSKQHFDQAVIKCKPSTEYITVEKAMELYKISRDGLYACIKRHNVPKIKEGKIIKLQKSALEALFPDFVNASPKFIFHLPAIQKAV